MEERFEDMDSEATAGSDTGIPATGVGDSRMDTEVASARMESKSQVDNGRRTAGLESQGGRFPMRYTFIAFGTIKVDGTEGPLGESCQLLFNPGVPSIIHCRQYAWSVKRGNPGSDAPFAEAHPDPVDNGGQPDGS